MMDQANPTDQIRRDPISGHWVVIAEGRASRPDDYASRPGRSSRSNDACPFCAGNESQTPDEVARAPGPPAPWQVRVVPNKYPAVARATPAVRPPEEITGLCAARPASGVHEVVIESPRHVHCVSELSAEEMLPVFDMYAERLRSLRSEGQWSYAIVFKNSGREGGASIEHLHSQLMATAWLPRQIEQEIDSMHGYHSEHAQCLLCAMIELETRAQVRVVAQTSRFLAFCPYASKAAMQISIVPRVHAACFEDMPPESRHELARLSHDLLTRLETLFPAIAFNYLVHTVPFDIEANAYYHWRIEVVPRLTRWAGFEWGSGSFINPVAPESAAEKLRAIG